ncbi:MAG: S8 family serine peptidase [Symploca sp. SIO2G7]|nr:S8 family serine peptidase [Symploca sp. SIO2G7]
MSIWDFFVKKRHKSHQETSQSFILEPILTPSGLLDGGDDTLDPTSPDLDLIDDLDNGDIDEPTALADIAPEDIEPLDFIDKADLPPTFESGYFTVGDTGEVSIDFLFDGGAYNKGEVALFSLEGMEEFELGSEEFIQEAARRALDNSDLGHVIISDRIEGARFEGDLGEKDHNSGQYLGVKTVQMKPGDQFGIMLVPNQSVEYIFANPDAGGAARPLFSMATANPDDGFHVGQLADVTGDGDTFVMEDWRVDQNSDRDYNDIIFQIRGATGEAIDLDEVIAPEEDWRDLDLGQELLDYAYSQTQAPEVPDPVEEIALTPSNPNTTIDLSEVFTDPDSDNLTYEIVDDSQDELLAVALEDNQLQLNQGAETGISNVAVRATDEVGNSYIHSFTVVNSQVSSEGISALNVALGEVNSAIDLVPEDPTVGLSSPAGEIALEKLSDVINQNPGLETILAQPNSLAAIGVNSIGITTLEQLLDSSNLAEDLQIPGESFTLRQVLNDTSNSQLDLYQINATGVVDSLSDAPQTQIGIIDFRADDHSQDVVETLTTVNPLAESQTLQVNQGNWAEKLVQFVDDLQDAGEERGVVNLSLELTQIDEEGRITTRYQLTPEEQQAIQYALEHNVLLVVAAGNTGDHMSALGSAAEVFNNIITVGSINFWGERAEYSGYGQGLNLVAPGGEYQGEHHAFVGTSKATAYVTAAASLAWAANPELNYEQIKQVLKETAVDLNQPGWDAETGAGLLNVDAAVRRAKKTTPETLTSPGLLTITPFNGAGRVIAGAKAASPQTEAAIAQLQNRQTNLQAQLGNGSTLSLNQLQTQVAQQTATALEEFQQISTEAVTLGAQTGQLVTALDLATEHYQIEQRRVTSFEEQIQQLTQQLQALEQQKTALEENQPLLQTELNNRINQAEEELQAAQTAYEVEIAQVAVPPTAEEVRTQVVWYRQQAVALAEEKIHHEAVAASQQVLKDRHLHQAHLAEQTRILVEELAQHLATQAAALEAGTPPEELTASYQQQATLAERLRQQAQANADWHNEQLQKLTNTTGLTGLLNSAQRAEYTRQRQLFEQLATRGEQHYQSGAFLAGRPTVKLGAMEQAIEAHQIRLQAEQDLLVLTEAEYEQQLAILNFQIGQTQAELEIWPAKQEEAQQAAEAIEWRVLEIQAELEQLQTDGNAARNQWQNYLNTSSAFLPQEAKKAIVEQRLQDLGLEEIRVQELILDMQQQLANIPDTNLQAQLEQAQGYLEELEQEKLLVLVHQDSLDSSALNSSHRTNLLLRVEQLEAEYQSLQTQWQTAEEEYNSLAAELAVIPGQATQEREELEQLRSQLAVLNFELTNSQAQEAQLEEDLAKAQQDLDLTQLQLTNQQLLLESLQQRDLALAQGEDFYYQLAQEQRQKLWYWNDRTSKYEYNTSEAETYQQALQHVSFMTEERNRIFQGINQAQARIAELVEIQPAQQEQVSDLAGELGAVAQQVSQLETEQAGLAAAIAPLAAIVDPLVVKEEELSQGLQDTSQKVDDLVADLRIKTGAQVASLERLISFGILAAEEDQDYFSTEVEPQVEDYIQRLYQREQELPNLGFGAAAQQLEERLEEAQAAVASLQLQQELDIRQQLVSNQTKLESLESLLASENAAVVAIQEDTVQAYLELSQTVEEDLQQAVKSWTKHFQEGTKLTQELGKEQEQLSQTADQLLNYIQAEFADPHGQYYRSETELREALAILSVGVQREDELYRAIVGTSQDIERLKVRLAEDEKLWQAIAPIVAGYGIDSRQKLQALLDAVTAGTQQYEQLLAEAKAKYNQYSAQGHAAIAQANWEEEQAKLQWELSRKDGPTWTEERWVCGKKFFGLKKKCGWKTFTHIDHHWIAWENHENAAKAYRQQSLQDLTQAEKWRKEIERLEPLVDTWQETNQAANQADAAFTETSNYVDKLVAGREDVAETQAQLELVESLLPLLQQQLQEAEQSTAAAQLNVDQAWLEYDPAGDAYRQALAEVLERQGDWQLEATETQEQIAQTERWIERQSVVLGTELGQVLALKQQLEDQKQQLEQQMSGATGIILTELTTKLTELDRSLALVTNKATVLTAQQAALTQQRTLLTAQQETILAEQKLLYAYLNSPDADTTALQEQLLDTRAALAEAQQLAEQAAANSQILTAPLQQLQTDLLVQNDEHLQAAREQQATLSQLLEATEANANYTLQAAQAQQQLNDLEFQIITRLQEATAAGSQEAKHLLDVAMYNDLATAAEIYFRDYQDLANDRGSKYGSDGTAEDAVLAEQYRQEMLRYQSLQQAAQQQANAFKAAKDAAQSQLNQLETAQQAAANLLNQLNKQINTSQETIATKERELAIAQARVESLARIRQQTEDAFVQLVRLEQLNFAQAELEQQVAEQRQQAIDAAVTARLEREQLELERQRLEIQFQIEQIKQQQTDDQLRQALNQVRADLGQGAIGGNFEPSQLQKLVELQATLATLQTQQPHLPDDVQVLLTEVEGDIQLALQGEEAKDMEENLLQAMEVLISKANQYKVEINQLEQQDQQDQALLALAQEDLQAASQILLEELERSQVLQQEREIINPLYLETLAKVAYAEQAVEISEDLAKQSHDLLDQIIDQRIEQRKARKKAFWGELLGTISSIMGLAGTILSFTPLAPLGIALTAASAGINAIQAAINGDWAGAIFGAVMGGINALTAGIGSTLSQATLRTIKTLQNIATGAFQGIRSLTSGDSVMGFIQIMSGVAGAVSSSFQGALSSFSQSTQKVFQGILDSLQSVPALVYGAIHAIEEGDWFNAIGNMFNAAISLGQNFAGAFDDTVAEILSDVSDVGNTVFAIGGAIKDGSVNGWLSALNSLAGIWGDEIAEMVSDIFSDPVNPAGLEDFYTQACGG